MKTIDLTPARDGYVIMLRAIIEGSANADDVAWAESELAKLEGTITLLPAQRGCSEEEF